MLMKICGPESEKMAGGWRKLHDDNFDESHCLSNNTYKMKYRCFDVRKNVTCGENVRNSDRLLVKKV